MKLDDTIIQRPKDLLRAFILQAELGGLDDGQAATAAGLDPSSWSQFKQGTRGIKPLELERFDEQCGNQLVLHYWAHRSGFMLTPRESELERRLRLQEEENERLRLENKVLRDVTYGRAR